MQALVYKQVDCNRVPVYILYLPKMVKKPHQRVVIVGETVPGGGLVARVSHGEGGDHVATHFTSRQPNNLAPTPPPLPRAKMSVSLNPPNALGFRRMLLAIRLVFPADSGPRTPYNPRQTLPYHHKQQPAARSLQSQDYGSKGTVFSLDSSNRSLHWV